MKFNIFLLVENERNYFKIPISKDVEFKESPVIDLVKDQITRLPKKKPKRFYIPFLKLLRKLK